MRFAIYICSIKSARGAEIVTANIARCWLDWVAGSISWSKMKWLAGR